MIPLSVDVPMKRLPWANWGLIVVTIVVSLAYPSTPNAYVPSLERERISLLVLQRVPFHWYQIVTSLFQHAGWIHLIGNMVFLFVFGNAINAKLGHWGFLSAYLGIGAAESFVWLVFGPGSAKMGASAAIMGLCGMFLVLYPRNDVEIFWHEFWFAGFFGGRFRYVPGWAVVVAFVIFDLFGALTDSGSNIAYLSHLVGAVMGFGLAIWLLRAGWLTPDRGEHTLLQWLANEKPEREETKRGTSTRSSRERTQKAQKKHHT